jgi:hypothetical protein
MAGPRAGASGRAAAAGGVVRRITRIWGALEREQRGAATGALALFLTMFLPWYRVTGLLVNGRGQGVTTHDSRTAIGVFSFVEASVLLVAVAVLWLLFARGENKAFHLPFGDGNVIFAAGLWVCLLVFWRFFDKPSLSVGRSAAGTIDLNWGIFVTFLAGLYLAFSGQRLRAAHLVEPALPGAVAPSDEPRARRAPGPRPDGGRPRPSRDASPTVVDRRDPSADETLIADIPEYGRPAGAGGPAPAGVEPGRATDGDPPSASTRVVRRDDDQLRLDDEAQTRADGQLRFDDDG